jgi:hypothetical protein
VIVLLRLSSGKIAEIIAVLDANYQSLSFKDSEVSLALATIAMDWC